MDYLSQIQTSIDFIERNLTRPILLSEVAREAHCSLYHFSRIFQAILGVSPKEYMRKRRLFEAALELIQSNQRIIEIAFKYQYQTPESFSRAFRKMFGENPGQYRRRKMPHIVVKKIDVQQWNQSRKEKIKMEPKIVTKDAFQVIGFEMRTDVNGENFVEIPKFWQKIMKEGKIDQIPNPAEKGVLLGLCTDFAADGTFSYLICAEVNSLADIPEGMVGKQFDTAKYAVFTAKGPVPEKIQEVTRYIYTTWFSQSGYQRANAPDFEVYDETRMQLPEPEVDIYVPIE